MVVGKYIFLNCSVLMLVIQRHKEVLKKSDVSINSIISVSAMAKKVGLSRARFYTLQREGFFPAALYCLRNHRPFYNLELQQQCIEVKATGIGVNLLPILFYSPRKNNTMTKPVKKKAAQKNYTEFRDTLKQMGVVATVGEVSDALNKLYPGGVDENVETGEIIRNLFKFFKGRV